MRGLSARLVRVGACAGWIVALAVVAIAWAGGDTAELRRVVAAVGIGAGAALTVAGAILSSLPPKTTAWVAGYRAALFDQQEAATQQERRPRHLRSVE